jgi:hypothetical protein
MMPDEWPIWTAPESGRPPAYHAGRDRLPTVRKDFFLDPQLRLTEQERALMTAMLHGLVSDVAAEVRAGLPEGWLPANEDDEELIARLSSAGLLDIEDVVALLLSRADEERIGTAASARVPQPSGGLVQPLVSDPDPQIAAAAMALLIARGRRRDRFGRVLVELADLPPKSAASLVFAIAAGLKKRVPVHIPASEVEEQLSLAARSVLDGTEPSKSLDSSVERLVRTLQGAGMLDSELVGRAIGHGDLAFLAHAVGALSGIHHRMVLRELTSGQGRRAMLVLRCAGLPRSSAAQLIAGLGDLIGLGDGPHLEAFDSWTAEELEQARAWMQLDPEFKFALSEVEHGDGHGSV